MAFKSQAQAKYCRLLEKQGRNRTWDCDKEEKETLVPISELPERVSDVKGVLDKVGTAISLAKAGLIAGGVYLFYRLIKDLEEGKITLNIPEVDIFEKEREELLSDVKSYHKQDLSPKEHYLRESARIFKGAKITSRISGEVSVKIGVPVNKDLMFLYHNKEAIYKKLASKILSDMQYKGFRPVKTSGKIPGIIYPNVKLIAISPDYRYYQWILSMTSILQNPKFVINEKDKLPYLDLSKSIQDTKFETFNFARMFYNDIHSSSANCPAGLWSSKRIFWKLVNLLTTIKNNPAYTIRELDNLLKDWRSRMGNGCIEMRTIITEINEALYSGVRVSGHKNIIYFYPAPLLKHHPDYYNFTYKFSKAGNMLFNGMIASIIRYILQFKTTNPQYSKENIKLLSYKNLPINFSQINTLTDKIFNQEYVNKNLMFFLTQTVNEFSKRMLKEAKLIKVQM